MEQFSKDFPDCNGRLKEGTRNRELRKRNKEQGIKKKEQGTRNRELRTRKKEQGIEN